MVDDSQTTDKLPPRQKARRGISFAHGEDSKAEERRSLRRDRIRGATLILLACFAIVIANLAFSGDDIWRWQALVLTAGLAAVAWLLAGPWHFSDARLTAMELGIVGASAGWAAGRHFAFMADLAESGERARLLTNADGAVFGFFAIVVIYGLVIPNKWGRTALVVTPLALYPVLEPFLLDVLAPKVTELAPEVIATSTMTRNLAFGVVGAIVSIYGSYTLNRLRREVSAAKQLGCYELKRKIGAGGMGEVWEARHMLLARPAAIKLIKVDLLAGAMEDPETTIRRFEREAQATASLQCPHTIGVFDFGTTKDGRCYYAMEFLQGSDLESLVDLHGAQPPERAVHIWKQTMQSLAEAHAAGMVHRDIKPANIYLCRLGLDLDFVKVLDFGLAQVKHAPGGDDAKLTQAGILGTPAYISPEAMLGRMVDGRADVYATACVVYWLLTGCLVFTGTAMEIATAHARDEPRPPSKRTAKKIPDALEALIMRCLAKAPADRPDSRELLEELDVLDCGAVWTRDEMLKWWKRHFPRRLVN